MNKKLKLFTGLLAVSFLTTPVLMGCAGGNNDNTSVTDSSNDMSSAGESSEAPATSTLSYDAVKTGTINAPDYVVVGDEFDLDTYVTIEGGLGPKVFDATLNAVSEGVCVIEGHKVKVLTEGTISIAIAVKADGNVLWKGKFATKAISAIKAAYQDYTKDITNQFMFYEIEEDEKTGEATISPWIKHTSEYVWFGQWDYEDKEAGTYTSGGIMRCGHGHTHFFEINSAHTEITVEAEHLTDLSYYYVAQDFSLPAVAFETKTAVDSTTGETQDYLYLGYDSPYIKEFLSYNVGVSWNSNYATSAIEVYQIDPYGTGELYWEIDVYFGSSANPSVSLGLGCALMLSTKTEDCQDSLVEKYIADKSEPAAVEYDEIPGAFDAIAEIKNYTMTTTTSFYYNDPSTREEVAITDDSMDVAGLYIYNGSVETTYVDGDKLVSTFVNGTESKTTGYYNKDGKAYAFAPNETDPTQYDVTELTISDIWASNATITTNCLSAASGLYNADFRVNSRDEAADGTVTFSIGCGDVKAWSAAACKLSTAGYGFNYYADYYDSKYSEDGSSYWDYVDATVVVAPTYVEYSFETGWQYVDEATKLIGYIRITTRITDVGTTEAPTLPAGL